MLRTGHSRSLEAPWADQRSFPGEREFRAALITGGVIFCLVLWLILIVGLEADRRRTFEAAARHIESLAIVIENEIAGSVQEAVTRIGHIQEQSRLDGREFGARSRGHVRLVDPDLPTVITDANGRILRASHPLRSDAPKVHPAFEAAGEGVVFAHAMEGAVVDGPIVPIVGRMTDGSGHIIGTAIAEFDLQRLSRFYQALPLADGEMVALVRDNGTIVARSNGFADSFGIDVQHTGLWKESRTKSSGMGWGRSPVDGVERLFAYRVGDPFSIIVGIARAELYEAFWIRGAFLAAAVVLATAFTVGLIVLALKLDGRRRQRFEQLRHALEAMDASSDGILVCVLTRSESQIVYANAAFFTLTQWRREEILGRSPSIFASSAERVEPIREAFIKRQASESDVIVHRRDGSSFWGRARIYFISSSGGEPTHSVISLTDITERKQSEARLLAAMERAMEANTAKTLFLANVSHELRTPLNAILGFTELLAEGVPAEKSTNYVASIAYAGGQLLELVENLIDVAHLELGSLTASRSPIDLAPLIEQVAVIIRPAIQTAGLDFESRIPADLPTILADQQRIKQILLSLLGNAVKFTRRGGRIVLGAAVDEGQVRISIVDTGIGMRPDDVQRLLQPFAQVEGGYTRSHSGSGIGLGLYIANRLTLLMGGRLDIDSEPGRGTSVHVRFPTAEPLAAP